MRFKIYLKLLFVFFAFYSANAQNSSSFTFNLSTSDFQNKLKNTPKGLKISKMESLAEKSPSIIELPLPDGTFKSFKVIGSEVMGSKLALKYTGIQTFRIFSVSKKDKISGTVTLSESGLHAILFTEDGEVLINPINAYSTQYNSSYQNLTTLAGSCGVKTEHLSRLSKQSIKKTRKAGILVNNGSTLKTYRLAIIANGEFYTNNGATLASAQTAVVSIVNSLKAVYEKELAVTFTLVASYIYTDAATDPFTGSNNANEAASAFGAFSVSDPNNFAIANYDLGQVLNHSPGGGGVAYLGVVCEDWNINGGISPIKAGGYSGVATSNVSTLIHEVGHQFGAGHTFNSVANSCGGGNLMTYSSVEPGSGSTFMSYYQSCGVDNLSGASGRSYFHANSVAEMLDHIANYATCATSAPSGNTPPVANAGGNKTIPKGTPFKLTGSGSDANGTPLYYNWEQMDIADFDLAVRGGADDAENSLYSPIFRSVEPTLTGNVRTFPKLINIQNFASKSDNDEALPLVARTINMRLTVRDNIAGAGARDFQDIVLTVDNSGPFLITSQNSPNIWQVGQNKMITWTVNGTNLAPLNVSNINILMSTDGGNTFPTTLAANTPNDGSHIIQVPNQVSTNVRIKIEPSSSSHIFFDMNNANINIVSTFTCAGDISTIGSADTLTASVGAPNLNLNLIGYKTVTSLTVNTTTIDPYMNLTGKNTAGVCGTTSNKLPYKKMSFKVNTSGVYNVARTTGNGALNIYKNTFDPLNPCQNWQGGSMVLSSTGTNTLFQPTLSADSTYILVFTIGTNAASTGSNTITITGPGVFSAGLTLPVSNYDYAFVITNSSNNVVAINPKADLSNSAVFTANTYAIRGLSYLAGVDLSSYVGQPLSVLQNSFTTGNNCGLFSNNTKTVILTCQIANSPTCPNATICRSGSISLNAINCFGGGVYNWYSTANGGTILSSGASFTIPTITATTSYFVDCSLNGCSSARKEVIVTVLNPVSPAITNINILSGSSSILTANSTVCYGGIISWYDTPTSTTLLGTGINFNVPVLAYPIERKSYFAACNLEGCISQIRSEGIISVCNTGDLSLVSPNNNISTGILKTFTTNGLISATNKINSLNGTFISYDSGKSIVLNPGFEVNSTSGASFKAIIKGCFN
jgi:Metallo-peptidase family M12/Ig-like domain CHU_C associated